MPRTGVRLALGGNGKLYAMGGFVFGPGNVTNVDEYDPATDTWRPRTPMPTRRGGFGLAAAANGKIYAVGGGGLLATVEEYDPWTDTWRTRAPMPIPGNQPEAAGARNGKVYVAGGDLGSVFNVFLEEYDPATDTWRIRAGMPAPRSLFGFAAASNGRLYAVGGNGPSIYMSNFDEYDPETDTWRSRAPLPEARMQASLAEGPDGRLYSPGGNGSGDGTTMAHLLVYDPTTDTWSRQTDLVHGGAGLGVATGPDGGLYVLGGYASIGSGPVTFDEAQLPLDVANDTFQQAARIAPGFSFDAAIDSASDVDYFRFTVDSGPASINVALTNLPANYDVFLYGPDHALLASSTQSGTQSESITAAVRTAGEHYVRVSSPGGESSAQPYRLRVDVTASGPTWTPTPTVTPPATVTPTATPTRTSTPTSTPMAVVALPASVPTVGVLAPTALPAGIATPDAAAGGRVGIVPTVPPGATAVAVINAGSGGTFPVSLVVPAPQAGEAPIGVRVQPRTTLETPVALPSGVAVAKVVALDVYDPTTGGLIHDHSAHPLTLAIQLTADEAAICRGDPGKIALLHVDSAGRLTRVAPTRLDCDAGIIEARLLETSSYAVARLDDPMAITLRVFVPAAPRRTAGGW